MIILIALYNLLFRPSEPELSCEGGNKQKIQSDYAHCSCSDDPLESNSAQDKQNINFNRIFELKYLSVVQSSVLKSNILTVKQKVSDKNMKNPFGKFESFK